MEDLRHLQKMGLMDKELVDGMQSAIDQAPEADQMRAAFNRMDELQETPTQERQTPKHCKPPLVKNAKKRARSKGITNKDYGRKVKPHRSGGGMFVGS